MKNNTIMFLIIGLVLYLKSRKKTNNEETPFKPITDDKPVYDLKNYNSNLSKTYSDVLGLGKEAFQRAYDKQIKTS